MAKMGYIIGCGLGKYGEGRLEPVEALVYPPGKSLGKFLFTHYNIKLIILKKLKLEPKYHHVSKFHLSDLFPADLLKQTEIQYISLLEI